MCKIVDFSESGDIFRLAGLTDGRIPVFDNIATAVEQGIDGVAVNWHGSHIPKDISNADFRIWANAIIKNGLTQLHSEQDPHQIMQTPRTPLSPSPHVDADPVQICPHIVTLAGGNRLQTTLNNGVGWASLVAELDMT